MACSGPISDLNACKTLTSLNRGNSFCGELFISPLTLPMKRIQTSCSQLSNQIQTVAGYRGKCPPWWTLVLGTSVTQTRPRAPVSAHLRPLLTYSPGGMFGDRRQGLKIWSAMAMHICTAGMLWGGLTHQCMRSIYSI